MTKFDKEKERYEQAMKEEMNRFTRRRESEKAKLNNLEHEKLLIKEKIQEIEKNENCDMETLKEYYFKLSCIEKEICDIEHRFRD